MSFLPELKRLAEKANMEKPAQILSLGEFGFSSETSVGAILEAYREITFMGDFVTEEYISLFNIIREGLEQNPSLFEAEGDEEEPAPPGEDDFSFDDLDPEAEDLPPEEDLEDGQSSFEQEYPEEDAENTLFVLYTEWLEGVKGKPFYKTIKGYYEDFQQGGLNILDRDFLWKFIKAVSSAITHIVIEAEQKVEAIILVETYFDGLIGCMNSVVHAADQEDVISSFQYMVDFLGISKEAPEGEEDIRPVDDEEF